MVNFFSDLKKIPVRDIAGRRVCVTIANKHNAWPMDVKVGFMRENREPVFVMRSPKISRRGHGKLFCWVPKGSISVELMNVNGSMYSGGDLRIAGIRSVSLLELGIRVGKNTPRKLLSIFKLLLAGNQKGETYRFARAVDELNAPDYSQWLGRHRKTVAELRSIEHLPNTSVLVTLEPANETLMAKTRDSLERQSWSAWQTVDRETISRFRKPEVGRLLWLNMPAGGVLEPNALELMVQPFRSPDVAAVYSDEDAVDCWGKRHSPLFKPAWSPLLARSDWMPLDGTLIDLAKIAPSLDLRTVTTNEVVLSIAALPKAKVVHLPQVLLSRRVPRVRKGHSTKPRDLAASPIKVSVVIPTRDRRDLLSECISGLSCKTAGTELDVIVVDNDSQDSDSLNYLAQLENDRVARVLAMPGAFNFAKACNFAVKEAKHELVLLLNNDVTPISDDWLVQMASELLDPDVGAVGAFLLYPDGLVQHAGVTLGAGSIARHSFSFLLPENAEDCGLLKERRDVSAVTAACLLTTKSLWTAVGGMDQANLAVAFNDVDYCLKLRRLQRRIVWTPYAKLWHHESVSRGKDDTEVKLQRFAHEESTMHRRWGPWIKDDPFHNPNLSKVAEDLVLEAFPIALTARTSTWE